MLVAFTLTMPSKGSWNGKWTGEGMPYVRVRKLTKEPAAVVGVSDGKCKNFWYQWPDGWGANIEAQVVKHREAERLKRTSAGFMYYDWMIDAIVAYGEIRKPAKVGGEDV